MEPFPDLNALTDDALATRLTALEREEDDVSVRRRDLHERIDHLRRELVQRVKIRLAEGELTAPSGEAATRSIFEGTGDLPAPHDLGPVPAVATMATDELRDVIRLLEREEDDVSLRRRVLHGQIDILRAERYRRTRGDVTHVGADDLASILSHVDPTDEAA